MTIASATRERLPAVVAFCARHRLGVILFYLVLAAASLLATRAFLGVNTDTGKMFSDSLPWKQRSSAIDRAFPQNDDLLVAVIDARIPEEADVTAEALAARLAQDHAHFTDVRIPGAGAYMRQNAFMFLDKKQLGTLLEQTVDAEPFLGALAAEPNLRGLDAALGLLATGVIHHAADLGPYRHAIATFSGALAGAAAGHPQPLSWQRLLAGPLVDLESPFRFVLCKPVLDYGALEPGKAAADAAHAAAGTLPFVQDGSARVRLTGPVILDDEEFASVAEGAVAGLIGSTVLVILWLFLAVSSARVVAAIVLVLVLGLLLTTGFAALAVGTLNLVSVAFAILFVGIAVDFAIQFSVRFREAALHEPAIVAALAATARRAGVQIMVAASAVAAGFLAFIPTPFNGVAELGLIAGVGMAIAFICTMTVLPALLVLFRARGAAHEMGFAWARRLDHALAGRRRRVLALFGVLAAASLACLPWLRFDPDPLPTKNPNTEAMHTLAALALDPHTNPYTAEMLLPSLAAADALARRLGSLPTVSDAVTLSSFVPDDQDEKLAMIADAGAILGPVLSIAPPPAPPQAPALRASLRTLAPRLHQAVGVGGADAQILAPVAAAVDALATAPDALLVAADHDFAAFLPRQLDQLRLALSAHHVGIADVPPSIRRDWLLPDGRAHVEVMPRRSVQGSAGLRRFVSEIRRVYPDVSGSAVTIVASAETIIHSFRLAFCFALVAITVILALTLRRLADLLLVLAPLLLAALLTVLAAVLLPLPFNFANIIALPLLLGVGVSFNIYFVLNWRGGEHSPLASPSARAVLFSALTTGTAFGSLALSSHPGTASMGLLLLVSLSCTLVATLFFLPALLAAVRR
jgi:hopanoid biosynthesis associated RND transporter like protein HpnN